MSSNLRKLLFTAFLLIIVLGGVLFSSKTSVELNYPPESSVLEQLIANVSYALKIGPNKKIEVDISQQKVRIFENNEMIREFSVSTGSQNTPTPTGNYKIYKKSVAIYSKLSNCWLFFWAGFTRNGFYGFHEVPICTGGVRGLEELGKPSSRGCIRLRMQDAIALYDWAEVGTPVKIYKEKTN